MESADKPRWYTRPLFSIDHVLLVVLAAQIAWFVAQKSGRYADAIPKGWMELIAVAILIVALLLMAMFVGIRWLFVFLGWRSYREMRQYRMQTVFLSVAAASIVLAQFATSFQVSQRQRAAAAAIAQS